MKYWRIRKLFKYLPCGRCKEPTKRHHSKVTMRMSCGNSLSPYMTAQYIKLILNHKRN